MPPFWTFDNLARITGGTWHTPPPEGGDAVLPAALRDAGPVLWHDTRDLQPGQCYLAIQGENFDGHDFVGDAFDKGAALAIVNAGTTAQAQGVAPQCCGVDPTSSGPILVVEDTVSALQDLARAYRDELAAGGCKVIGVAGSNGKTTTRHLIHHVLTHAGKHGTQSPKSFNNHLGVPLTLLAARPTDDFVACEIGTNHPGEIDFLGAIARPDIAVITSIGEEHLEFFGDLAGVLKEELSIIRHIQDQGVLVTPGEWDWACNDSFTLDLHCLARLPGGIRHIRVGEYEGCESVHVDEYLTIGLSHTSVDAPQQFVVWLSHAHEEMQLLGECTIGLSGHHNLANAAYTVAVARQLGLGFDHVERGLISSAPPSGRGQTLQIGSISLINDAYNANPSSMRHGIALLSRLERHGENRRVAVLGDMFELGDDAALLHDLVIDELSHHNPTCDYGQGRKCSSAIDQVILLGEHMGRADSHLRTRWSYAGRDHVHCFPEWTDDLPDRVAALLQPGDTVLLKASRGMQLERLIPAIEKRFGKAETPLPVNET